MTDENKILAIVPARGGSKRLPQKNILNIAGKPLINWTIEAGLGSTFINRLIVSTDDSNIADIARSSGADVPFIRPDNLSLDSTTSFEVIEHCLSWVKENEGVEYDYIILLQPTSPLRNDKDINNAFNILFDKNAQAVISLCETEHSPLWSNTIDEDSSMKSFLKPDINKTPSQDLPKYYRLNGAIYICQTKALLREKNLYLKDNIYASIMSKKNSIDIDDQIDFDLAELYLNNKKTK